MTVLDSNYLHLWYVHFDSTGAMREEINKRKEQIKNQAKDRIKISEETSSIVEQEYEKLYQLTQKDFETPIELLNQKGEDLMSSFDSAVLDLKNLIKAHEPLTKQREKFNKVLSIINEILEIGAENGYTTQAAYDQIKNAKKTIEEARSFFSSWAKHDSKEGKETIAAAVKTMEAGTAGYIFEFAHAFGKVTAKKKGHSAVHDLFINIGGDATFSDTLRRAGKEDPEFQKDLEALANALDENNGTLAKGDQILMYHEVDGQGKVIGETHYVVFQDKTYSDIHSVHVYEKTFGQLGIEQYFNTNDLVNIAGGLGSNLSKSSKNKFGQGWGKWASTARTFGGLRQGEIDNIWKDIRISMRLLSISDAIAGEINANMTMKPNYYVVRDKKTGRVRVIGTSRILRKIKEDLSNAAKDSSMGIGWKTEGHSKADSREKYWKFNIGSFHTSGENSLDMAQKRSEMAYPWILKTINEQKISIALNFGEYFVK